MSTRPRLEGAIALGGPYSIIVAPSGAVYNFDLLSYDSGPVGTRQLIYYASSATYPDGEVISYTYQTANYPSGQGATQFRVTQISSNIGYHIAFSYQGSDVNLAAWKRVAQGSVVAVTDNSGSAIIVNRYDEWGVPSASNAGRFQYTGQAWIPELGMYHYKARIYSPTLGRFLQTDPIGYDDQVNLYAYVGNDPVNATDPTGTESNTCSLSGRGSSCSGNFHGSGLAPRQSLPAGATVNNSQGSPTTPASQPRQVTTNPPQHPPSGGVVEKAPKGGGYLIRYPDGSTARVQPAGTGGRGSAGYPNGYWRMTNAGNQPIDISTGKPPGNVTPSEFQQRTHVHLPTPKSAETQSIENAPSGRGWSALRGLTNPLTFVACALFCLVPQAH